jgi:hypothetical protein
MAPRGVNACGGDALNAARPVQNARAVPPAAGARVLRIEGRWYDVSRFEHPGGPVALSLGIDRDATVLFRSSHPFTSRAYLRGLLERLELPEEQQAYLDGRHARLLAAEPPFVFDGGDTEALGDCTPVHTLGADAASRGSRGTGAPPAAVDAFEREVKAIAREYFTKEAARRGVSLREATKAPPRRWAEVAGLTLLFALSAAALVRGSWLALAVAPTLAWVWMVNFWHDAAHFAMSSDWRVNAALTYVAPWFSSPLIWYHQHVIGHHVYTNVERRDPDMYHAPACWRFSRGLRWRPLHAYQALTTPLLWLLSVWTLLGLKPLAALWSGSYNRAVVLMALPWWRVAVHLLGRLAVLASLHLWPWYAFPGQPLKALAFATVPVATIGLWFMVCSQVNHHAEELSGVFDRRWYRHQVSGRR